MAPIELQYPTQTVAIVGVVESDRDGEPGYMLNIDQKLQWIPKSDADDIARYILFGENPDGTEATDTPVIGEA